LTGSTQS